MDEFTKARAILASALSVEPCSVTPETSIENLDAWDSLGHLRIMLEMESTLGRELTSDESVKIFDVQSIGSILAQNARD